MFGLAALAGGKALHTRKLIGCRLLRVLSVSEQLEDKERALEKMAYVASSRHRHRDVGRYLAVYPHCRGVDRFVSMCSAVPV
jgi:hypothetical protein